jgi:hypothetical protein
MRQLQLMLTGSLLTLFMGLVVTTACLGISAVQSAYTVMPAQPIIITIDSHSPMLASPFPAPEVHYPVSPLLTIPSQSF